MNTIFKLSIQKTFDQLKTSPQIFNVTDDYFKILEDIVIIQSFYGLDIERISATTNALKAMVQSTTWPAEWIFVEGQEKESECCFKWLRKYGIKHKFVKLTKQQKNLFLKTPLWNIGATISNASKLCFIDSDISFCNSSWLESVNDQFESGVDVMSLHGFGYHENQCGISQMHESIGHAIQNKTASYGHYGFTIGMTRNAFNKIGGFECSYILDDLLYWSKITGGRFIHNYSEWSLNPKINDGLAFKVGSTEEVVCHNDHGELKTRKYRALIDVAKDRIRSFNEIIEYFPEKPSILPKWKNDSLASKTIYDAVDLVVSSEEENANGNDIYFKIANSKFGEINDENPLIICTVFRQSFVNGIEKLERFKEKLEEKCKTDFQLVCFSDVDLTETRIDFIPTLANKNYLDFMQIFRSDVEFPKNSNILFIPFDFEFDYCFELCRILDDDICLMDNKLLYVKNNGMIFQKFSKSKMIGRNIEEFLYFNSIFYCFGSKYIHRIHK